MSTSPIMNRVEFAMYKSTDQCVVGLRAETVMRLQVLQQAFERLRSTLTALGQAPHFDIGSVEIRSRELVLFEKESRFETVRCVPDRDGVIRLYRQSAQMTSLRINIAEQAMRKVLITKFRSYILEQGATIAAEDVLTNTDAAPAPRVPEDWVGARYDPVVHGRVRRVPALEIELSP